MNSNFLLKKLALPVGAATIISSILAYFIPLSGFFINLATTLLGVLITVFYVDLVLRQQNKIRWHKVKSHCIFRIERIANFTIGSFRTAFKFDADYLNTNDKSTLDRNRVRRSHSIFFVETELIPSFADKVNQLSQDDWNRLMERLNLIMQLTDRTFDMFANHIDPEILECILEIQHKADEILASYSILQEVYGIPTTELPTPGGGTIHHQKSTYAMFVTDVKEMLEISCVLLRRLNQAM